MASRPAPQAYLCLGRAYESLGDAAQAADAYSAFVAQAPGAMKAAADEAAAHAAALRALPGKVDVQSTPPGAEIWVDGKMFAARTPAQIELAPGKHTVRVVAPSHLPEEREIDVAFASTSSFELDLKEAQEPVPAPPASAEPRKEGPPPRPTLVAVRTRRPPKIDGMIGEAEWRDARTVSAFTQKAPFGGSAPTEKTTMRILYDDGAVYVAFDCEQARSPVVAVLARRDRPTESDWVSVGFDSHADGRSAFEFSVNAAGVLTDGIRFDDGKLATEWDEVWEAATRVRAHGWSAELRIPLHALRFEPATDPSWGFQARRYISARQEFDEWAYIPREVGGEVSHYGRIQGFAHLEPDNNSMDLRPFVVGQARHQAPDPAIVASGWSLRPSVGLDLTLHFSESFALNGTINPDFGQVEADQLILNLTTVELLFPEKRPFFLAGMDAFATMVPIFYTRRIGHTPPPPPFSTSPSGPERLYEYPQPSQIYGAAKVSGDLGHGWTVAGLSAMTSANAVNVDVPGAGRDTRLVDPLTSYNVLRIRTQVVPGLDFGVMGTAAVRAEPYYGWPLRLTSTASYPTVPTADGSAPTTQRCPGSEVTSLGQRCFHDAYVGSADLVWRSPSGEYALRGQGFGSAIENGPTRVLPDGTRIAPGDLGAGGILRLSKQGGEHWLLDGTVSGRSRALDFNDLGYMDRQNYLRAGAYAEYRTLHPSSGLMETHTSALAYGTNNIDGLALDRSVTLMEQAVLANRWTLTMGGYANARRFDDREVGDGTALERSAVLGAFQGVYTDPREPFVAWAQTVEESLQDGANFNALLSLTWRPVSMAEFLVMPAYTYNYGEPRYAGTGQSATDLVFGRLEAMSASVTLRASYTFVPTLTLQTYAQMFLATTHYFEFAHFATPAAGPRPVVHLSDLSPGAPPPVNPDGELGSLAVNVVLMWEYHLGSMLYLVYTRSQNPSIALDPLQVPRLDPAAPTAAPAADVFMVKLAYWIG